MLSEPAYDPPPQFNGSDFDDDDRAVALSRLSQSGSDEVSDADMFSQEEAASFLTPEDVEMARARAGYEWDWEMTPSQRASKVADLSFSSDMASLVDELSEVGVVPQIDPYERAAEITSERYARRFGNG